MVSFIIGLLNYGISIHALMKRATNRSFKICLSRSISIHALMKRATFDYKVGYRSIKNFNPRPHEEGDLYNSVMRKIDEIISIHALMKRATTVVGGQKMTVSISIHALMKRATNVLRCDG